MQKLLHTIRARKLDRAAAVYAVAGWALVQAAAIALPVFGAPQWTERAFIALVIVGFPITLILVWVVGPHPHHAKGRPPVGHYTEIVLLTMLAIVFLAIAVQLFFIITNPARPTTVSRTERVRPISPTQGSPKGQASVAVLPFANMSSDPSNRYFSDGISAELIGQLSQVPGLRVAAQASSFSFRTKDADVKTIAQTLGVNAVLDGSVRIEGSRVRIEADLNSSDGFTIWSHSYDNDLTHILDLQNDIARAITAALTHELLGKSFFRSGKPTAIDPEAYRQYLEGRYEFAQRNEAAVADAIRLFTHVTRLQPNFADGFAALARAESTNAFDFGHREFLRPAEVAVDETLRLDPNNVEALLAQSALSLVQWDWESAAIDLHRLRALAASTNETLKSEALLFKYLGFPERSLQAARASAALDPLYPIAWANIASDLFALGRYGDAEVAAANGLALLPGQPDMLVEQCGAYAHTGQSADAEAIAKLLISEGRKKYADGCLFEIALANGRLGDARQIADRIARDSNTGAARLRETVGQYFLLLGDTKTALAWFERAFREQDLGFFTVPTDQSTPPALLKDPGWKALWQKPAAQRWLSTHDRLAKEFETDR